MMRPKKESRFIAISNQATEKLPMASSSVIKDKETGVLYLFQQAGYGAGLTVLLDRDGKPFVDLNSDL
ncbi:hypothetical protein FACS1894132_00080 [Clostridia bacterium]|nr:hypothetical protein FACS1894132_00080 [Clostridia bacterium]